MTEWVGLGWIDLCCITVCVVGSAVVLAVPAALDDALLEPLRGARLPVRSGHRGQTQVSCPPCPSLSVRPSLALVVSCLRMDFQLLVATSIELPRTPGRPNPDRQRSRSASAAAPTADTHSAVRAPSAASPLPAWPNRRATLTRPACVCVCLCVLRLCVCLGCGDFPCCPRKQKQVGLQRPAQRRRADERGAP